MLMGMANSVRFRRALRLVVPVLWVCCLALAVIVASCAPLGDDRAASRTVSGKTYGGEEGAQDRVFASGAPSHAGEGVHRFPRVPANERSVGIAYSTWFPPIGWTDIWSTPTLGPYNSSDPAIIRQHGIWLADAGVDFIFIDWSNISETDRSLEGQADIMKGGKTYLRFCPGAKAVEEATTAVFDVFAEMKKRPRISIFLGAQPRETASDGRLQRKADLVYESYIANPKYKGLYQHYLGKPLLVVYVGTPSPWSSGVPSWDDGRFTIRYMTGFLTQQPNLITEDRFSKYGYWSWEDRGAQTYPVWKGRPEVMTVVACWRGDPACPTPGRREGATFREQWARARQIGPRFALVVSWNEWTTLEQLSPEVSKDIEPSETYGHFYLDLLKEEIARFKSDR